MMVNGSTHAWSAQPSALTGVHASHGTRATSEPDDSNSAITTISIMNLIQGHGKRQEGQDLNLFDPTQLPPTFTETNLITTIVLSLLFLLSLLGNVTTIIQMMKHQNKHSTIYTLILQLATADLIVTFFVICSEAVWNGTVQWYGGTFMCKFIKYAEVFGLYLSTYITVIISIDRCCAIMDPMSRNRAARRVKTMIIVAWVLSAIFSSPQAFMFSSQRGPWEDIDFYQCVNFNFYTAFWQERLYLFATVFLMFIIPLLIMLTCYSLIFITISRKSRDIESENNSTEDMLHGKVRSQLLHKAKTKSLKMTAIIVAAFVVCWTPYYVMYGIHTLVRDISAPIIQWLFASGMLVSVINPVIYGAFHMCRPRNRRHYSATPFVRGKVTANSRISTKSTLTSKHMADRNGVTRRNGTLCNAGQIMYVGNGSHAMSQRKTTPLLRQQPRSESPVLMEERKGMLVTYVITEVT